MLNTFKQFLADEKAWDMFITGPAGTGKTTGLKELLDYCLEHEVNVNVCAFTHKACGILADKLTPQTPISTLHSFLKKRPSINDQAVQAQHIEVSRQHTTPKRVQVLFIDEFSMVGEKDYMDIVAMQDPEYEGQAVMKVVYIGDLNQLPPVGDQQTIVPMKPYWVQLNKVYRQAEGNELLDLLHTIVGYIEGKEKPQPLVENDNFIRGCNIAKAYKQTMGDSVMLAYTNERVEKLNAEIASKTIAEPGDNTFSPTTRDWYTITRWVPTDHVMAIETPFSGTLMFDSKFKTLEHLLTMKDISYVEHGPDDECLAVIFGHYQYKLKLDELKQEAADANREIEAAYKSTAKAWASANPHKPAARRRAKAWRDYLTFKECVICIDFPYAMTIHKSQGSTYDTVFIDTDDLYKCATYNFSLYLRLLYVAISRASNMVYTN